MKAIPQITIVRLTAKQADKIQKACRTELKTLDTSDIGYAFRGGKDRTLALVGKVYKFLPDNWKDILGPAKTVDAILVPKEYDPPVLVTVNARTGELIDCPFDKAALADARVWISGNEYSICPECGNHVIGFQGFWDDDTGDCVSHHGCSACSGEPLHHDWLAFT